MEQSKIVRYIQTLSRKEQEKFYQHLISPCFNQHEKTTLLLEIILRKPLLLEHRDRLFGQLYPGEPFDEQRLHNLFSNLKKLYVKFLSYQQLEANEPALQLFALEKLSLQASDELLTINAASAAMASTTPPADSAAKKRLKDWVICFMPKSVNGAGIPDRSGYEVLRDPRETLCPLV